MKKMRLVIGYDGSPCSDAALDDLNKAGLPRTSEVSVISAVDIFLASGRETWMSEPVREIIKPYKAEAKALMRQATMYAAQAKKKVRSRFPGWRVRFKAVADSPAGALVKDAARCKANLIVVGAHGHSKLGRFLGSVSQMVLTQAECSVRVGRPSLNKNARALRILIGIDGSPDSAAAVKAAASRSWPAGTEFLLISAIDPKKSTFIEKLAPADIRWFLEQADNQHQATGRMLESFAKKFREKDWVVTCEVKDGDPKKVLVKEAETWRADTIFVGARGLTHMKRFFMGGVSTAVAARAHCSVEVIRNL